MGEEEEKAGDSFESFDFALGLRFESLRG